MMLYVTFSRFELINSLCYCWQQLLFKQSFVLYELFLPLTVLSRQKKAPCTFFFKKTNKLCFTVESRNNSCEIIETTDKLPPEKIYVVV